jgi:hypothetical protein
MVLNHHLDRFNIIGANINVEQAALRPVQLDRIKSHSDENIKDCHRSTQVDKYKNKNSRIVLDPELDVHSALQMALQDEAEQNPDLQDTLDELEFSIQTKEMDGGIDIFISAQTFICADHTKPLVKDFRIIWGYCRLRIVLDYDDRFFIEFFNTTNNQGKNVGRIRELKVNGTIQNFNPESAKNANANANLDTNNHANNHMGQHRGIGSRLLRMAEEIALSYKMDYVTVTSSVGVRDYYRKKHGYELDSCGLMWKKLS